MILAPLAGVIIAPLATAQTEPAAPQEDVVELERYVVTGSNIPTALDAMAVPVTILGPTQIDRIGQQGNLLDVIRKAVPFFAGNANLGNSNANTAGNSTLGGSQISLRNLDTLVLLNGRRVSPSGASGRGGRNFVDVNQFPIAAVDRIEILSDGASAIYGSDAIGGVVNIILKTNFTGLETGGRYAFSNTDGDYTERSFSITSGVGSSKRGFTISANYSKTDPLFQKDRPFSKTIIGRTASISGAVGQGTAFPTHFLNPALNSPAQRNPTGPAAVATTIDALVANGTYQTADFTSIANTFDLAPYVTLILDQEQKSFTLTGKSEIFGRKLELFGDMLHSSTSSTSQLAAQVTTPNITAPIGSPYNPLTIAFTQVAFRYTPAPRIFRNESGLSRFTLGFRGEVNPDLRWEVAYTGNRADLQTRTFNVLYAPNVNRAVAGGFDQAGNPVPGGFFSRVITGFNETSGTFVIQPALDPFARPDGVAPGALNNILGASFADFRSDLTQFDAKVSGNFLRLPAGKIGFALGADLRTEKIVGSPDENTRSTGPTARRWLGATFFDPFDRGRDIDGYFAELRVPVTGDSWHAPGFHTIDLTAAFRSEKYSDAGKSEVPKIGLRWLPIDHQLVLRYNYSESFVAPVLYSLFGPTTQGFTATNVVPNIFGVNGQAQSRTGSNPNLRPSTAKSHATGIVYSPKYVKGLTVSATYVHVDQVDLVGGVGVATILQSVEQLGPASPYASQVSFVNFPGEAGAQPVASAGQLGNFLRAGNSANLIYVADTNRNIAGQKVRSVDFNIDYESAATSLGKFDFSTAATFFFDYKFQALPDQPYYEYAGIATSIAGTGTQGTLPGYRFYSSLGWTIANTEFRVGHTYIPSVDDQGTGGNAFATNPTATRLFVDRYQAWDVSVAYRINKKSPAWISSYLHGATIGVGVTNLTDEMPPAAPNAFNDSGVDISTYNPIGRLYYVRASMKF